MDFVVPPLVRAAVTGSPLIGPKDLCDVTVAPRRALLSSVQATAPECISLLSSLPACTNRRLSGKAKKEVLGFLLRVSFFIYYNKLTANVKRRWPSPLPSSAGCRGRMQHP